jgi:quinol monooxygenase YgiN
MKVNGAPNQLKTIKESIVDCLAARLPTDQAVENCNFLMEIDFQLHPPKEQEFRQHLDGLKGLGPGCLGTAVYEDIDRPGKLLLVSKWTELPELEAYVDSNAMRVLIGGLETLGTVYDFRIVELGKETRKSGGRYVLRKRGIRHRPKNLDQGEAASGISKL